MEKWKILVFICISATTTLRRREKNTSSAECVRGAGVSMHKRRMARTAEGQAETIAFVARAICGYLNACHFHFHFLFLFCSFGVGLVYGLLSKFVCMWPGHHRTVCHVVSCTQHTTHKC